MRNSNRICPACIKLAEIWSKVPDWRLAQLLTNVAVAYQHKYGNTPFYVEDEEYLKFMEDYIHDYFEEPTDSL